MSARLAWTLSICSRIVFPFSKSPNSNWSFANFCVIITCVWSWKIAKKFGVWINHLGFVSLKSSLKSHCSFFWTSVFDLASSKFWPKLNFELQYCLCRYLRRWFAKKTGPNYSQAPINYIWMSVLSCLAAQPLAKESLNPFSGISQRYTSYTSINFTT